jgi:hypothetical protein
MASSIRKAESPWGRAIWAYYLLGLHTIAAVAITVFMLYVIDGRVVNYSSDRYILVSSRLFAIR